MKKYKCHKIVEAGEIVAIHTVNALLAGGELVELTTQERQRLKNTARGEGYLVRYEDDYLSWSPKAVFEAGYTALE